ncbi:hypothetical protein [Actinoallomurus iriomotensis]|uniref:Uncharacterized protein n=1 Tax=Actinoallomurus iriomotensis TaxID=478107 RepID=A0A9W6RI81_9ACTN|nr:hypothetical protein [Actinoallomurus iriomotensis]GLY76516.1 hypothetical protein Airi01_047830 [Actinoallomurus iriomotensis]
MNIFSKAIELLRGAKVEPAVETVARSKSTISFDIANDLDRMSGSVYSRKSEFDEAATFLSKTRGVDRFEPATAEKYYIHFEDGRAQVSYASADIFGTPKLWASKAGEALKELDRAAKDASEKARKVAADGFDHHSSSYRRIAADAEESARGRRQTMNELRDAEQQNIESHLNHVQSHTERLRNYANAYPHDAASVEERIAGNDSFVRELNGYASNVRNWGR